MFSFAFLTCEEELSNSGVLVFNIGCCKDSTAMHSCWHAKQCHIKYYESYYSSITQWPTTLLRHVSQIVSLHFHPFYLCIHPWPPYSTNISIHTLANFQHIHQPLTASVGVCMPVWFMALCKKKVSVNYDSVWLFHVLSSTNDPYLY